MAAAVPAETLDLLAKQLAESKFREVADACEKLAVAVPTDVRVWRILIRCYVELDRFRDVFMTMDRMLEFHSFEELYCHNAYFGPDGYIALGLRRRRDFAFLLLTLLVAGAAAEIGGRWGFDAAFLSLLAGAIVALAAEIFVRAWAGYRFGLPGEGLIAPGRKTNPFVFYVADKPLYEYDDVLGFRYVPRQSWTQVAVAPEGIVERRRLASDRHGNLLPTDEDFDPRTLNILTIGDSFTCLPGNGDVYAGAENAEWPYIMKVFLEQEIGAGKTRVMNFARVSNGVLQMMASAAQKAAELKPDLVIIAFLTRDMERPPRYVSPVNVAGKMRQFMHHTRGALIPDFLEAVDMAQVDARVSQELSVDQEATFLKDARANNEMFLRRLSGRMFQLKATNRSLLLDLVLARSVFTHFDREPLDYKAAVRVIDATSYDQDPRFAESLAALNATNVPVMFVHLPEVQELKTKSFMPHSKTGEQLFRSFMKLLGKPVYFLSQYLDLPPEEVTRQFNRTSYDIHPSLWTKTVYADLITQLVLNECKSNKTLRRKIGMNDVA